MVLPPNRFAVLGAGCGGQTFAGHLASKGLDVVLYNRSPERIQRLKKGLKVSLEGVITAEGILRDVTDNIAEAVSDAEIIFVVTTALGHGEIGRNMAEYLHDGQIILLNPGRTFGSLEMAKEIYSKAPDLDVTICEANTLLYATRVMEEGIAQVHGLKQEVTIAAVRPWKTVDVLEKLQPIFPQMVGAKNILETSLGNIGAVFHPTITIANAERIKKGEDFDFYIDGVQDRVIDYMMGVDDERMKIAHALDTEVPTLKEWVENRYGLEENSLKELLHNNPAYMGLKSPKTLLHRYILEDVPTGLVPLSYLGSALGIPTVLIDSLIIEAESLTGIDFRKTGRTLERLGLSKANIREELMHFVYTPEERSRMYR